MTGEAEGRLLARREVASPGQRLNSKTEGHSYFVCSSLFQISAACSECILKAPRLRSAMDGDIQAKRCRTVGTNQILVGRSCPKSERIGVELVFMEAEQT